MEKPSAWLFFLQMIDGCGFLRRVYALLLVVGAEFCHPRRMETSNVLVGCLSETILTAEAPEKGVFSPENHY